MSLDFTLSDEHKLVQTSVGQMLDKCEPRKAEFREMARDGKGFPEELWQEDANMAKFLGADLAIKAVDHAIETHGGLGFAEETGLINQWSGARLFKTAPVSREMILNYVSESDLGLPKSY